MEAVVTSIARREFGERPIAVKRVAAESLHETYELRYRGAEYVLKLAGAGDAPEHALQRGLGWYRALQDSEVPVPGVVTETVREVDGRQYVVVEKLPGETADLDVAPTKARSAGRHLAGIHDARQFEEPGRVRFDDEGPTVEAFEAGGPNERRRRHAAENVVTLREAGLDAAAWAVERLLEGSEAILPADLDAVLCHGDFSPDNVCFADGSVTGVLDFDRAHAGHAGPDLARAANAFWMHDPGADWDVRAELYGGYREARGFPESFERFEPVYRVETLADAVAGLHDFQGLSAYERDFYDDRIVESVERVEGP